MLRLQLKNFRKTQKSIRKKTPFPFNKSDVADGEMVDYNNDYNISVVSSNKSTEITAQKIVQKYKSLAKKKAPLSFNITDLADDETLSYNNNTNNNDENSS